MFKKLFKFGKKKRRMNENEVVNVNESLVEVDKDEKNETVKEDIVVSNEDTLKKKLKIQWTIKKLKT